MVKGQNVRQGCNFNGLMCRMYTNSVRALVLLLSLTHGRFKYQGMDGIYTIDRCDQTCISAPFIERGIGISRVRVNVCKRVISGAIMEGAPQPH